jgi:PAS domain S-box-containing protein
MDIETADLAEGVMGLPFRGLFAVNPHPLWVYDQATLRFLAVNDAAVMRYGYSRDEFLTMTVADIRPPDERARLRAALPVDYHEGAAGQWTHVKADGSLLVVEIFIQRISFGDRAAILGMPVDITARVAATAALHENERRLKAVADNIPGIVFQRLRTPSGVITHPYFSPAALEILDLTAEQAADSHNVLAAIHPDDRAESLRLVEQSATDLSPWAHEFRICRRNGDLRWLNGRAAVRRQPDGSVLWDGIMMDVTDRKRAELALLERGLALRQSREHLARAQKIAHVGSIEVDFRDDSWRWSDETYAMYGLDKDLVTPSVSAMLEIVHPDDRGMVSRGIASARRGDLLGPVEFRVVRSSGEVRVLYRQGELIRDERGTVIGAIATEKDVTELRATERQKDALQRQLWHLQRMEGLGTFAGGIAHDLNSTLVPVIAMAEFVQRGLPADSPARGHLDLIRQAGEHARDLLSQLLAFSRQGQSDMAPLDLADFLRHSMSLVRAAVPRGIQVVERIAEVPPIVGDRQQLHRVLLNLVANAAQAIGDQPGAITIELARGVPDDVDPDHAAERPGVRLSIIDTGCGMDEPTLRRVFEPFFTTKPVGEGTGLGLSVVHGIVVNHHGRIVLDSEVGRGTRIDVYLPLTQPAHVGLTPQELHA